MYIYMKYATDLSKFCSVRRIALREAIYSANLPITVRLYDLIVSRAERRVLSKSLYNSVEMLLLTISVLASIFKSGEKPMQYLTSVVKCINITHNYSNNKSAIKSK